MIPWKSALLWASYPFLFLIFIFALISAVNWDYESKLIFPDYGAPDWPGQHLGLLMLAGAAGLAFIASILLFVYRFFWPKAQAGWFFAPMIVITILWVSPSLFIVILGPAAVTMIQQMRSVSR
jgi:hypothetical protein